MKRFFLIHIILLLVSVFGSVYASENSSTQWSNDNLELQEKIESEDSEVYQTSVFKALDQEIELCVVRDTSYVSNASFSIQYQHSIYLGIKNDIVAKFIISHHSNGLPQDLS